MINFKHTIQSEKVLLRPMQKSDFDEMTLLTKDSKMWYYFTTDLSIPSELKRWISMAVSDLKEERRLAFTVIDRSTNKIIGSTSIGNISKRDRRAEIGWTWICKAYQGKGYNAHVKYLLLKYLIEDCDLERVELKTDVLNMPARKAMEKIGLVAEGILRSHTQMINNRRRDTIFYSVLKSEWLLMKETNAWGI